MTDLAPVSRKEDLSLGALLSEDEEEDDDFVPDSLRDFFKEADATLNAHLMDTMHTPQKETTTLMYDDYDYDETPHKPEFVTPMTEGKGPFDTDLGSGCAANPVDKFMTHSHAKQAALQQHNDDCDKKPITTKNDDHCQVSLPFDDEEPLSKDTNIETTTTAVMEEQETFFQPRAKAVAKYYMTHKSPDKKISKLNPTEDIASTQDASVEEYGKIVMDHVEGSPLKLSSNGVVEEYGKIVMEHIEGITPIPIQQELEEEEEEEKVQEKEEYMTDRQKEIVKNVLETMEQTMRQKQRRNIHSKKEPITPTKKVVSPKKEQLKKEESLTMTKKEEEMTERQKDMVKNVLGTMESTMRQKKETTSTKRAILPKRLTAKKKVSPLKQKEETMNPMEDEGMTDRQIKIVRNVLGTIEQTLVNDSILQHKETVYKKKISPQKKKSSSPMKENEIMDNPSDEELSTGEEDADAIEFLPNKSMVEKEEESLPPVITMDEEEEDDDESFLPNRTSIAKSSLSRKLPSHRSTLSSRQKTPLRSNTPKAATTPLTINSKRDTPKKMTMSQRLAAKKRSIQNNSSSTSSTVASPVSKTDASLSSKKNAVAMAKERVRRHLRMRRESTKSTNTFLTRHKKVAPDSTVLSPPVQNAVKQHRERVQRVRELHQRSNPKQVKNNSSSSSSSTIKRQLTVPKAPRLSTSEKYGPKQTPVSQSKIEISSPTRVTTSTKRRLTIPKGPRLSTSEKYGDKPPPSITDPKDSETTSQINSSKEPRTLTTPKPFKFRTSQPSSKDTPKTLTMMERMQKMQIIGFRENTPKFSSTKVRRELTRPKSPNFVSTPQRPPPKSTAEIEEELMEQFAKNPFKARPIGTGVLSTSHIRAGYVGDLGLPKVTKKEVTTPCPFRLATEIRGEQNLPAQSTEEIILLENGPFRARPMPDFSQPRRNLPIPPERKQKKKVTSPLPLKLSTENRHDKHPPIPPSKDEVELAKKFHARPMPNFQNGPRVQKRIIEKKVVKEETFDTEFHARPMPDFNKNPPSIKKTRSKLLASDSSQRILNARMRMKKMEATQHLVEEAQDQLKNETKSSLRPFRLSTSNRKSYGEDNNEFKQFKARPIPASLHKAPTVTMPSRRKLVEPKQFELETSKRESLGSNRLSARTRNKNKYDEESTTFSFKAKPMPVSIFRKKEISPKYKETKTLTEPVPFTFQSERRLATRKMKNADSDAAICTSKDSGSSTSNRRMSSLTFRDLNRSNGKVNREIAMSTKPKPFRLSYDERHQQHSRALQQKIEEHESEIFRQFQAKPVPKTTFKANFTPSKTNRPLIEPKGPNLRTNEQAKARKKYDESVRIKKQVEEQIRAQLEEEEKLREEAELKMLRELPVSEGGFIPKAKPIGASAGFSKMRVQRERSWSATSSENDESRATYEQTVNGDASSQGGETASGLRSLISGFRKVKLRDSSSVVSSSFAG